MILTAFLLLQSITVFDRLDLERAGRSSEQSRRVEAERKHAEYLANQFREHFRELVDAMGRLVDAEVALATAFNAQGGAVWPAREASAFEKAKEETDKAWNKLTDHPSWLRTRPKTK